MLTIVGALYMYAENYSQIHSKNNDINDNLRKKSKTDRTRNLVKSSRSEGRFFSVRQRALIFASVLLASRLTSNSHSFAIVTFAIALFGVFPIFRHAVRLYSQKLHLVFTVLLFFLVWRMLNEIAYFLTVIYVVSIFIINIVAPGFFITIEP